MKVRIKLYGNDGKKLRDVEYTLDPIMSQDKAEELLAELATKILSTVARM